MIVRCPECNKLLLKINLNGYLKYEIVCPKCKFKIVTAIQLNEYTVNSFRKRNIRSKR